MSGKLIATVGDTHTCPMVTGNTPHIGGTIITGASGIFLNDKPVARMGDKCICTGCGMTCIIIQGDANVLVDGKPIAYVGCMTSHGGVITSGQANAFISGSKPINIVTMPINKIPFEDITTMNRVRAALSGHGNQLNESTPEEAQNNDGEPKVYNYQWRKEETIVRDRKVLKIVTLTADVMNIPDGETATFKVTKPADNENDEAQIVELTGTVKDRQVTVEWELEDASANENTNS